MHVALNLACAVDLGRYRRFMARRVGYLSKMPRAAILDIDGTLVDTNYQHALGWFRAFRKNDVTVPLWRIHRHIGIAGDLLVEAVAGKEVDSEKGDAIREAESRFYSVLIGEVTLLDGARDLILSLKEAGCPVVLASSAKEEELEHYLKMLDVSESLDGWTSSGDVDMAKPEPDVIQVALEKAGRGEGVMIGDSTWDCEAAKRAGVRPIGVLTGGFSEGELREAGAERVYRALREVIDDLDDLLG
jgi:phosphoglycolate phosphatase-like HAD superfamily hydrolase